MKAFLRSYGAHALAYALSALTVVAGLPAPLQTVLGPHAGQIVGVAGILLTAAHNTDAVVNKPGAPSITTVAKVLAFIAIMVMVAPVLTACTTVQGFFASPAAPVVVTVGVDVAVAAAEQNGVKASDINRIAKIALAANASTSTTLGAVAAVVNGEIATLNLPPLDVAAANALELVISQTIQAKVGDNPDLVAARADVAQVLQAVITATGG